MASYKLRYVVGERNFNRKFSAASLKVEWINGNFCQVARNRFIR